MRFHVPVLILLSLSLVHAADLTPSTGAKPTLTMNLWPSTAPGEKGGLAEERDETKPEHEKIAGKILIRLGNVATPTLTVYSPPKDKATDAAVVICPGGAYHLLAYDLEGTEVADWLNSIGVTAIILKYRVPSRQGLEKHAAALQDAQRAVSLVRQHAAEWRLNPKKIGILGFSAGGHLAAATCNNSEKLSYETLDAVDQVSNRPDFALLIYPAYLTEKGSNLKLNPEVIVSTNTPPTFLVHAQDDPVTVENSLAYAAALNQSKLKVELHLFPYGKHGYGLRPTDRPVTHWPPLAESWLRQMKLIP